MAVMALCLHHRSSPIPQIHLLSVGNKLERSGYGNGLVITVNAVPPEDKLIIQTVSAAGKEKGRPQETGGQYEF